VLDFRITCARLGRRAYLVSLAGEIDLHVAPRLSDELEGAIADGAHRLVVDLSGVSFIDSSGIATLVRAAERLRIRGAELVLVCDDHRILRALEVTGLDGRLPRERTLTEAIARGPRDRVLA
jgi:anti-sigma B factor antagonist